MNNSEHSVSTATPDKQERLDFLTEKSNFITEKLEVLRKNLIILNDTKLAFHSRSSEKDTDQQKEKMQSRILDLVKKAKSMPLKQKSQIKTLIDPREGITRRFADFIPIKRYQFTEDTLNIFYPNVADKYYTKLSDEWKLNHESSLLRNTIEEDLVLFLFINKFNESEEAIEIYRKFRNTTCESDGIRRRYKNFRERMSKKRSNFIVPGCSVKVDEGLTEATIIKTHKELFCRRCEVYDCGVHGILGFSNFVHPDFPTNKELLTSYQSMLSLEKSPEGSKPCGNKCYLKATKKASKDTLSDFIKVKIKLIFNYLKNEYSSQSNFPQIETSAPDTASVDDQQAKKKSYKSKPKKNRRHYFPNWKKLEENVSGTLAIEYQPCYHKHLNKVCTEEEQSCSNSNCCCFERGFCDKYCGCDLKKCKNRKGCDCKSNCLGKKCPCYSLNAECDPDLCKCCFTPVSGGKKKVNNCQNLMIYFSKPKNCKVGPSEVCTGLGLFNIEPIAKGEFVTTYIGELISWEEAEMREKWNNYDQETYLCTVSDEYVIDAKYRGNKARFINHGKSHANIVARHVFSRGLSHFAFYAKDDIQPGTELLFDYEGGGSALREQFAWVKQPNAPKNHHKVNGSALNKKHYEYINLVTGLKAFKKPDLKISMNAKVRKLQKIELKSNNFDDDEDSICYAPAIDIVKKEVEKTTIVEVRVKSPRSVDITVKNEYIQKYQSKIVDESSEDPECSIISVKYTEKKKVIKPQDESDDEGEIIIIEN